MKHVFRSLNDLYLKEYRIVHLTVVMLCGASIYWPVYHFNFLLGWDDQWFVLNHYTRDGFTSENVSAIFKDFYYGQYAPINQLYYTGLYSLFKYDPLYFHVAGLIIHLLNASLVYFFLRRISSKFFELPNIGADQIAFVSALLFVLMPINLEPVAWIAASKVTLYGLFYLIALNFYCKFIIAKNKLYFYLTLLFFTISFAAKEQAVLLPVCLLLMDYVYNRDFKDRMLWYEKLPFFVLSLLFGLATIQSQGIDVAENNNFYPFQQRIVLAFYTISEYFSKCVLPINLSYLYPFPFQVGEPTPWWLWIYMIAIPIIGICFFKKIPKWLVFGILFFVIHILLVVNIFSLARFSIVADRYAYVSTIGLSFILGYAFVYFLYTLKHRKLVFYVGLIYIGYFMIYTRSHLPVWQNAVTLKQKLRETIKERADFKIWKENIK